MANYWENPFWRDRNWYGGEHPTTGRSQDWYNTPEVRDDASTPWGSDAAKQGEWVRFYTEQGFGGNTNRDRFGQNQAGNALAGFDAASLSNPGLTWRKYLNTLEGGWMDRLYATLTPQQRGAFVPGQTRTIRDG
jgi:hypothetical protein